MHRSFASVPERMVGTIGLVLLLAAGALAVAPPVVAEEQPTPRQQYDISLAELLDENGRVVLPEGFSGSVDPAGYQMVSKSGEAPRFARSTESSGQWSAGLFGFSACNGIVYATVVISGELFLGGDFQTCGFASASNVVRFDPDTGAFSPLGDGVDFTVRALTAIGTDLYVGGEFSTAGGAAANRVAVYDTTSIDNAGWSTLGTAVNADVYALTAIGTDLYVGGFFTEAGGAPANRIAVFDTTRNDDTGWSTLGDGMGSAGVVYALTAIGDDLYVGGSFSQAGGSPASFIAVFDTTQSGNAGWSTLGDGLGGGSVRALTAIGADLYVGGLFTQAGGQAANRVAKFDTTQTGNDGWSALGDGVGDGATDFVFALAAIGTDLYVGGQFQQAGGAPASGIAVFDTTQGDNTGWSALGDGVGGIAYTLSPSSTSLYVGGNFSTAGAAPADSIAIFDTTGSGNTGWSTVGSAEGLENSVLAIAVIGTDLYVGGGFTGRVAVWDTTQPSPAAWTVLGDGVNNVVRALAVIGDDLYVGGDFTEAGGEPASRIAVFDTTQTGNAGWSALGSGTRGRVWALAAIDSQLYVGGQFTEAGGAPANRVAVFDTTRTGNDGWSALGDGVNGNVWTLTALGTDLYVGGRFIEATGYPGNYIAVYDTTETGNAGWSTLGTGLNGDVFALTAVGTDLYVGGFFSEAGGQPANNIAVYDTTQAGDTAWSALGDGVGFTVVALAPIGNHLYVGGFFTEAGGISANYVAAYDTTLSGNTAWSALGDGLNERVQALTAVGNELYVGGQFTEAGGNVNAYLARYTPTTGSNAPPVAADDSFVGLEDQLISGNVFSDNGNGADSDPEGDSFEVQSPGTLTADGIGGSVDLAADGSFTYTPPADVTGQATFGYTIVDPLGATGSASVMIDIRVAADLVLDKISGSFFTPPGGTIEYEILVVNAGPSDVVGAQVVDVPPAELSNVGWSCTGFDGALCQDAGGIDLIDQIVDLPDGGSLLYILSATLPATGNDPVTNTAEVVNPIEELDPASNSDSDTDLVGLFADGMESVEP